MGFRFPTVKKHSSSRARIGIAAEGRSSARVAVRSFLLRKGRFLLRKRKEDGSRNCEIRKHRISFYDHRIIQPLFRQEPTAFLESQLTSHANSDKIDKRYGNISNVWVWRRLVARYLGVVEAAGSSPVTQTNMEIPRIPLNWEFAGFLITVKATAPKRIECMDDTLTTVVHFFLPALLYNDDYYHPCRRALYVLDTSHSLRLVAFEHSVNGEWVFFVPPRGKLCCMKARHLV